MRQSHTKSAQLDLFGPPGSGSSVTTPQWQNLPNRTRRRVTSLVARLLIEHYREETNEPGAGVGDRHPSGESGDV